MEGAPLPPSRKYSKEAKNRRFCLRGRMNGKIMEKDSSAVAAGCPTGRDDTAAVAPSSVVEIRMMSPRPPSILVGITRIFI